MVGGLQITRLIDASQVAVNTPGCALCTEALDGVTQLAIHLKEQQQMNGGRVSDDGGLIRQLSVIDLPGALNSASGTPLLATHVKALLTERIDRLRPSQQLTLKVSMPEVPRRFPPVQPGKSCQYHNNC